MAGKYSKFKDSLTKLTQESSYQERVNYKKEEIKKDLLTQEKQVNFKTIGEVLLKARVEKDRLEDYIKEQNLIIAAMDQELVDMLEGNDLSSVKLTADISMSIKDDIYCSVSDKESFYNWVDENGLGDLYSVNYQTMSSMIKNKLVEGEDIPPGISVYFKQSITVRGVKNFNE